MLNGSDKVRKWTLFKGGETMKNQGMDLQTALETILNLFYFGTLKNPQNFIVKYTKDGIKFFFDSIPESFSIY
jgi:hypothetical protein